MKETWRRIERENWEFFEFYQCVCGWVDDDLPRATLYYLVCGLYTPGVDGFVLNEFHCNLVIDMYFFYTKENVFLKISHNENDEMGYAIVALVFFCFPILSL